MGNYVRMKKQEERYRQLKQKNGYISEFEDFARCAVDQQLNELEFKNNGSQHNHNGGHV